MRKQPIIQPDIHIEIETAVKCVLGYLKGVAIVYGIDLDSLIGATHLGLAKLRIDSLRKGQLE